MVKHIGSTLESLFDELGEREDFDALLEKKLAEKVPPKPAEPDVDPSMPAPE